MPKLNQSKLRPCASGWDHKGLHNVVRRPGMRTCWYEIFMTYKDQSLCPVKNKHHWSFLNQVVFLCLNLTKGPFHVNQLLESLRSRRALHVTQMLEGTLCVWCHKAAAFDDLGWERIGKIHPQAPLKLQTGGKHYNAGLFLGHFSLKILQLAKK